MKIDKYYRNRAREVVDMMHDKGFFDKEVTRESMRQLQNLIAYYFQQQVESAIKIDRLSKSLKK